MGYWLDTSLWQGELDVAALECDGVIAKMSQGSSIHDPQFISTFERCRERGMAVGAYHFLTHAAYQGSFIQECLAEVGLSIHEPLPAGVGFAVDFEPNSISGEPAPPVELLAELCEALSEVWGRDRVGIYSDLSRHGAYTNSEYAAVLEPHPKWIAWPGPRIPYVPAATVLWQNDIRTGIPGVHTKVDYNEVLDPSRLDRWFGAYAVPPAGQIEVSMLLVFVLNDAGIPDPNMGVFLLDTWMIRWISDGDEVALLRQGSVREINVTADQLRRLARARTKHGPGPTSGPLMGLW